MRDFAGQMIDLPVFAFDPVSRLNALWNDAKAANPLSKAMDEEEYPIRSALPQSGDCDEPLNGLLA